MGLIIIAFVIGFIIGFFDNYYGKVEFADFGHGFAIDCLFFMGACLISLIISAAISDSPDALEYKIVEQ